MGLTYSAGQLFDEAHQIHASKLNKWKYFEQGQIRSGELTWSSRGSKTGSISFRANLAVSRPYIELNYTSKGSPISYNVFLDRVKSNLGKGWIWYFICPMTRKRCRILYGIGHGFFHREAFKRCYYETQTYSRKSRALLKIVGRTFIAERAYDTIYKKNFKKFYANKPTRRYQKLLLKIKLSEKPYPKN